MWSRGVEDKGVRGVHGVEGVELGCGQLGRVGLHKAIGEGLDRGGRRGKNESEIEQLTILQ